MKNVTRQGLSLPPEMLEDMREQAKRLDRPLSWLIQRAWRMSRDKIAQFPSPDDLEEYH